jgi:hypothetical protein
MKFNIESISLNLVSVYLIGEGDVKQNDSKVIFSVPGLLFL